MQIYDSYIEAGQKLSKKDKKEFYSALIEYLYFGIEPSLSGSADAVFTAIKPTLELSRIRSESGSKGGSTTKANAKQTDKQTQSKPQSKTKSSAVANGQGKCKCNSNVEKDTSKDVSQKKFQKPTPEQVKSYATEKDCPDFDAERFVDFYESKGWVVGKSPMKDWQAAVRQWISREQKQTKGGGNVGFQDEYSFL